jgi:multicomponent Na+:H+ antiporter subunit C
MVLTAIVITFGITAFLLALALRSYLLTGTDAVEDDIEDRRIGRFGRADGEQEAAT